MKVELRISGSEDDPTHEVFVDGKEVAGVHNLCECSEDAMIGRDLIDGNQIVGFIKMGYEAGKRGETLEISEQTSAEE